MHITMNPIGVIHTPYTANAPFQPVEGDDGEFRITVNDEYREGLKDLDTFTYIYAVYYLHRGGNEPSMVVKPPWAEGAQVGLFASRTPNRPNGIGISVVRIEKIEGTDIVVSGLDAYDGTPLLDIKPYIAELDVKPDANYGWVDTLENRDHLILHIKGMPH